MGSRLDRQPLLAHAPHLARKLAAVSLFDPAGHLMVPRLSRPPVVKRHANQQARKDNEVDDIGRARPSSIALAFFFGLFVRAYGETAAALAKSGHRGTS